MAASRTSMSMRRSFCLRRAASATLAAGEWLTPRKAHGRSLDDIIAAKPTAAYDEKSGTFVIDPKFFTRLVYGGCLR